MDSVNLLDYSKESYYVYGSYTIEQRAIPDFRDGLLPVRRRLVWAGHKLDPGVHGRLKSARLIGDVLGKYHPHGDTAAYQSLVQLVQNYSSPFIGEGNWGSYDDPKSYAAMRYTEWGVSAFGRANYLTTSQLRTIDFVPNFDGTDVEPVYLPSNIPYLLLIGAQGIAVGTTTGIPTYSLKSVVALMKLAMKKKVTAADCQKTLEFQFPWGGKFYNSAANLEQLKLWYETGSASLYFDSDYSYDAKTNSITITGIAPQVNFSTAMIKTVALDGVSSARDETDQDTGVRIRIYLAKGAAKSVVESVAKIWRGRLTCRLNVTHRKGVDESGMSDVEFFNWNMPQFITSWVEWRIEQTKKEAKAEAAYWKSRISEWELSILAAQNWKVVGDSLDKDEPEAYLVSKLKITLEQATTILDKVIRSLKNTNIKRCRESIENAKARIAELKAIHSNPTPEITRIADGIVALDTN